MTDKEKAIREIQQGLRNIEKSFDNEPSIIPDGIYSAETRRSVENFQDKKGLGITGVVDYETWTAIISESGRIDKKREPPIQVAPVKNEDLSLKEGDKNELVLTLKMMLNHVADKYAAFNRLELDNTFDVLTRQEVLRWQRVAFLEESGEADKETWNSLARFYLIK